MAHRIVNNQDATEEENLLEFQRNQADELANSYDERQLFFFRLNKKSVHRFAPQQRGFRYPPGTIPPDYYTCNRCHIKGHFIYHCPLGKDGVQARPAAYEEKKKIFFCFLKTKFAPVPKDSLITSFSRRKSRTSMCLLNICVCN